MLSSPRARRPAALCQGAIDEDVQGHNMHDMMRVQIIDISTHHWYWYRHQHR